MSGFSGVVLDSIEAFVVAAAILVGVVFDLVRERRADANAWEVSDTLVRVLTEAIHPEQGTEAMADVFSKVLAAKPWRKDSAYRRVID
jgi:hypothetical protein